MTWSGLTISTSCEGSMSPAVTGPSPFFFSVRMRLAAVVQAEHHALEVEQDVDDVLAHAVERRVLVHHAGDLHLGRRVARHRGQQHAAQRVAERVAVAALERLHRHLGVRRGEVLHIDDARLEKSGLGHGVDTCVTSSTVR